MRSKVTERGETRNFIREAEELIKGLKTQDLYSLFEIVIKEQQRAYGKPERMKELEAVQQVLKIHPMLEKGRHERIERGPGEMARTARAKDGNTDKHHKKV